MEKNGIDDERRIFLFRRLPTLPGEIIEEILSRLPVKVVTKLKCVCRRWCILITSEPFIYLHHRNFAISHLLTTTIKKSQPLQFSHRIIYPPLDEEEEEGGGDPKVPLWVMEKIGFVHLKPIMSGSCNGIICLHLAHWMNIVLYNPAIEDFKVIQKPPNIIRAGYERKIIDTIGFGFDPKTNDYKILQFAHYNFKFSSYTCETEFKLYSVRRSCWRKLETPMALKPRSIRVVLCNLHRNRIICWLVKYATDDENNDLQLAIFDMSHETFEISPLDVSIFKDKIDFKKIKLLPFRESIALFLLYKSGCHIWVSTDFYDPKLRSWTRLWSITNINITIPFSFWGKDQFFLLFFERADSKELKLFDLRTHELLVVAGHLHDCSKIGPAYIHKDSLFRISQLYLV